MGSEKLGIISISSNNLLMSRRPHFRTRRGANNTNGIFSVSLLLSFWLLLLLTLLLLLSLLSVKEKEGIQSTQFIFVMWAVTCQKSIQYLFLGCAFSSDHPIRARALLPCECPACLLEHRIIHISGNFPEKKGAVPQSPGLCAHRVI